MDVNTTMLGSGRSPAPTYVTDCTRLVSPTPRMRIYSPYLFLASSTVPAWKRLIDRPLDTNERISLITDIFSDRSEIEAVRHLGGDDAQSFVDVMDEVSLSSFNSEGVCRIELLILSRPTE